MLSALAARLKPHRGQVTTHVRLPATGEARGGMAPVYGMADTLPFRGMVGDMLKRYIDLLYRP